MRRQTEKYLLFGLGILLIFLSSFVLYHDLFNTFFTQDEWWELGRAVDAKTQGIDYYFKPWGGHVVPLMLLAVNLQFWLFGTNIWPYAALAILGHAAIATTLALFVVRLTKRPLVGWLSGFIFAVNTAPFHAVTYIAGGVTHIHGTTILFLLSLIFFAKYIQSGHLKRYFFSSLACLILALAFSEYVAFYFFFIPLCYLIFAQWRKKPAPLVDQALFVALGAGFFIYRFLSQKIHLYGSQFIGMRTFEDPGLRVDNPVFDYFSSIVANTAKLLPRVFYQVWMTEDIMNKISAAFSSPTVFSYQMSILVVALIATMILILVKLKRPLLVKIVLAATLLTILGAFPAYVFPTLPNVIESRYLYLPSLGFSVLFSIFLVLAAEVASLPFRRYQLRPLIFSLIILLIVGPFLASNYLHITKRLENTVIASKMRQKILKQALAYYPHIQPKTVFFTSTNLSTPGIPWPVSLGYTFLVMHTYHGDYQGGVKFFRSNKLWPISEGYEDHGNIGFGLFHDFAPMLKTLKQYQLSEENVYAFHWEATPDSKRNLQVTHAIPPIYDGELLDITQEIRPMVKKLLATDKYDLVNREIERYFSSEIELSFARPSKATFVNSNGLTETADFAVPRLTDEGMGTQPGVLIEGPSTNLLLFSEEFNQSVWQKSPAVQVLTNVQTAPDGQKTADKLIFSREADYLQQPVEYFITDPGKTDYTFSLYLMSPVKKTAELKLMDKTEDGPVQLVTVGPFWRRFEITASLNEGGPIRVRLFNTTGELFAWGAQLEESAYSTSYIPTETKFGFRAGDVFRAYPRKSLSMSQGTVGIWVRPEWNKLDDANHILFYNGESTAQNSVKLEASSKFLRFTIMDAEAQHKYVNHPLDFEEFKNRGWNYVAATWVKGKMSLYLNGQAVGEIFGPGTGMPKEGLNFSDPHRIGVHHGWYSMYADALLSQFEVYDRPLSAGEVFGVYNSQKRNY